MSELFYQFFQGIKFDIPPYIIYKRNSYFIIIDISGEVQYIHFQCNIVAILKCRTVADVEHSFIFLSFQIDPDCINPDPRYNFKRFVHLYIGCWKSQFAADFITVYNRSP